MTSDVASRLNGHTAGQNPSTDGWKPWEIDVCVEFRTERMAVRFEKYRSLAPDTRLQSGISAIRPIERDRRTLGVSPRRGPLRDSGGAAIHAAARAWDRCATRDARAQDTPAPAPPAE